MANDTSLLSVPTRIEHAVLADVRVVRVAAGEYHSMAVTEGGRLLTWGGNDGGNLGLGDEEDRVVPTLMEGVEGVVGVAAGTNHSLISLRSGKVMAFGSCGREGQYGDWGDYYGDGSEIRPPDGRLGLGPEVGRVLVPTVVPEVEVEAEEKAKKKA